MFRDLNIKYKLSLILTIKLYTVFYMYFRILVSRGKSFLKTIVIPDKQNEVESDQESLQWHLFLGVSFEIN